MAIASLVQNLEVIALAGSEGNISRLEGGVKIKLAEANPRRGGTCNETFVIRIGVGAEPDRTL